MSRDSGTAIARLITSTFLVTGVVFLAWAKEGPKSIRLTAHQILFDKNGHERAKPITEILVSLGELKHKERLGLVEGLCDVAETSHSFGRVVALGVLAEMNEMPWGRRYLSQRAVSAFVRQAIRIGAGDRIRPYTSGWPNMVLTPVVVRTCVHVDDIEVPLCRSSLPYGWRLSRVRLSLDGKLVRSYTHDQLERLGMEVRIKPASLLSAAEAVGKHEWLVEATVVAPNGLSETIREKAELSVVRRSVLDH